MKKIQLTATTENKNNGINREWALCKYYGIERHAHDSTRYDVASDVEVGELQISAKASKFTLMSGTLTKGCKTFEGIWRRYYKNVHSNTWAYITADWTCYLMDKKEFSKFVHSFGTLTRDSQKNGGGLKIQGRPESPKMIEWFEMRCA